jgi:TonB family protein
MRHRGVETIPQISGVGYGALELKRSYQKHLGVAVIIAGFLHVVFFYGLMFDFGTNSEIQGPTLPPVFDNPIQFAAPPPVSITQIQQVPVAQHDPLPISVGIATAVPDKEAPPEVTLASQHDLGRMFDRSVESILAEGNVDSIVMNFSLGESFPERGEYVYRDEDPVALNRPVCEYPPLALQAGIEGMVLIEALVDKGGNVRDAWVVKASGCKAGFEEAALKAAYQTKYKPAISSGQPVAVRVTYPVQFRLK